MGDDVLDVAARLGLEVDRAAWLSANDLVEGVTARMREMHASLVKMRVDALLFKTDVKQAASVVSLPGAAAKGKGGAAAGAADEQANALDRVATAARRLLIGFVALRGGRAMGGWISDAINAAGEASDMSHKMGISARSVQELEFAAKLSGVEIDTLRVGMSHFAVQLADVAKTGKGPVADAFATMHISVAALRSKMSGPGGVDDALALIADKIAAMPDGMSKTATAVQLFGRAGADLIPLLNEGASGIAKFRARANELGLVVDDQVSADMESFGDRIDEVKFALKGIVLQVSAALLPTLKKLVAGMQEWLAENKQTLIDALTVAIKGLALALVVVAKIFAAFAEVLKFFSENSELAIIALSALGAALTAWAARAAASFLIAQAPLLPWLLLLTAIIAVVYDVWRSVKTGHGVTATVFRFLRDKFSAIAESFRALGSQVTDYFSMVGGAVVSTWQAVANFVGAKIKWITDKIDEVKKGFKDLFGGDFGAANDPFNILGLGEDSKRKMSGVNPSDPFGLFGDSAGVSAPSAANPQTAQVNVDVGGITVNPSPGMDENALAKATAGEIARVSRHIQATTGAGVT